MKAVVSLVLLSIPAFGGSIWLTPAVGLAQTADGKPLPPADGLPRYEGTTRYGFLHSFRDSTELTPLHDWMLSKLDSLKFIPQQRYHRFAYHNQAPVEHEGTVQWSRITKWKAAIADVEERANGWIVTVQVQPEVKTDWGGYMMLFDHYFEMYAVSRKGVVSFIGHEEGTGGMLGGGH